MIAKIFKHPGTAPDLEKDDNFPIAGLSDARTL
jgi:hypothetical protein